MKTFKATVRVNGRHIPIVTQARQLMDAKDLIEAQYGRGSISIGPVEVR